MEYIANIDMEIKGRWYKPGDQIPAALLGLQRNVNFLLARGRIRPVAQEETEPVIDTGQASVVSEPPKNRGGRPRKGPA